MTLYFEPKFQQISLSWSCALHTAVSFLSRGKIRKACLRGTPLDIPSTKWNIATFSRATTRNFVLAETVTLPNFSKPSENGASRHSRGQRHKNFVLAETVTLPITVNLRRMEQRDILEGNEEKFCFSRDCNVTQFHKTFGEWSNATFSRATA